MKSSKKPQMDSNKTILAVQTGSPQKHENWKTTWGLQGVRENMRHTDLLVHL